MRKRKVELAKRHRVYFNVAKNVAELSDFKRVHIGCCVVYRHRIISSASNSTKTHPLQRKLNKYRFDEDIYHPLHAETRALLPLINRKDIDFSDVSLYLYREDKNGNIAPSNPCPSCEALIKKLGIKNIYFTNNGGFSHEKILC